MSCLRKRFRYLVVRSETMPSPILFPANPFFPPVPILRNDVIGPPKPPARRSVSGFPAHSLTVASLPILEQIELRLLVDWVIQTHEFASLPVVKISCIGHADRDFQRGKAFEQQISEQRAAAVKTFFLNEISRLTYSIFDLMQPGFVPVAKRINFESIGLGS
jgi:hypothetical protein